MKEKILDYVKNMTKEKELDYLLKHMDSQHIADIFHIKRNTVSQYLNESAEKDLVKINTRPVLFLHREEFIKRFFYLSKQSYSSIQELLSEENQNIQICEDMFQHIVGYNGSLQRPIEQMISSILYPDNSLPILLHGPSGSGKSYLAGLMHQFAIQNRILSPDAPFNIFNCAQYANNPELLSSNLFGHSKGAFTGAVADTKGILAASDNGMLFLDEVHRLNFENQEKLFIFLDKGIFRRVGENAVWQKANVRIIMATTEDIHSSFLETFIRRIPVIATLPSLENRSKEEKLQLISLFFYRESKVLGKHLLISKQVVNLLLNASFKGNAGGLFSVVKYTCAKAYSHNLGTECISIKVSDLPDFIIASASFEHYEHFNYEELLISPEHSPLHEVPNRQSYTAFLNAFFSSLAKITSFLQEKGDGEVKFENAALQLVQNLYHNFLKQFGKEINKSNLLYYVFKIVSNVFRGSSAVFHTEFTRKELYFISLFFYVRLNFSPECSDRKMNAVADFLFLHFPQEVAAASRIFKKIQEDLDLSFDKKDYIILILFLKSLCKEYENHLMQPIILTYRQETADSICQTINDMLGFGLFTGLGVSIEETPEQYAVHLVNYVDYFQIRDGLLIFSDVIALEELKNQLGNLLKIPFVLIGCISVNTATAFGHALLNRDCYFFDNFTKQQYNIPCYTHQPIQHEKTLLAVCPTGGVSKKLKNILKNSIPQTLPLTIIDMPYDQICKEDEKTLLLKQYEPIGIIGVMDPKIADIPFLYLHELTAEHAKSRIHSMFSSVAEPMQIDEIIKNLVRNLSLDRLIGTITILDGNRLLINISNCLDYYEQLTECSLSSRIRYCLYFHLSCLIERLIRKEPITACNNLEYFIQTEQQTIDNIKTAFHELETSYGIDIPTVEIKYLSDILKENPMGENS